MEGLRWDSLPDEAAKASLEKGNSFHLLACRYFSGIPYGLSENAKDFELLTRWMRSLENYFTLRPEAVYLPEHTLRAELDGLILEANFDLIILEDGRLNIWDWKTHGSKAENSFMQTGDNLNSTRSRLEKSLQTMVYMYVLCEQANTLAVGSTKDSGTGYLSEAKGCDTLCMRYWQPEPPHILAEINYDAATHEKFRLHLKALLKKICEYDFSEFDKSLYSKYCKRCEFNWYCNGLAAQDDQSAPADE